MWRNHDYTLNEAHRLILGLPSDLNHDNPHSEHCDEDLSCPSFTEISESMVDFCVSFDECLNELTMKSPKPSKLWKWLLSPKKLAARKTIRTVYIAVDLARKYIAAEIYEDNDEFAGIMLNVILEMTGLPCLPIDLGSEKWRGYTQMALNGNMEPLMVNTLNELIEYLGKAPDVSPS